MLLSIAWELRGCVLFEKGRGENGVYIVEFSAWILVLRYFKQLLIHQDILHLQY